MKAYLCKTFSVPSAVTSFYSSYARTGRADVARRNIRANISADRGEGQGNRSLRRIGQVPTAQRTRWQHERANRTIAYRQVMGY